MQGCWYCNSECQFDHWKMHKEEHRENIVLINLNLSLKYPSNAIVGIEPLDLQGEAVESVMFKLARESGFYDFCDVHLGAQLLCATTAVYGCDGNQYH